MNTFRLPCAVSQLLRRFLGTALTLAAISAFAQLPRASLHGAHELFVSADAAIVWAVLKTPVATNSDKASVWLRIVNTTKKFSHVSIDGVDPFSKKRERIEPAIPLKAEVRVQSDRDSFSELPSRELHFYRSEADLRAEMPALTVYYLGVPDQTPEFSNRAALDAYFSTVKLEKHSASP